MKSKYVNLDEASKVLHDLQHHLWYEFEGDQEQKQHMLDSVVNLMEGVERLRLTNTET